PGGRAHGAVPVTRARPRADLGSVPDPGRRAAKHEAARDLWHVPERARSTRCAYPAAAEIPAGISRRATPSRRVALANVRSRKRLRDRRLRHFPKMASVLSFEPRGSGADEVGKFGSDRARAVRARRLRPGTYKTRRQSSAR